ncbi:hypothetical protein PLESTB_000807300 [Pleodorina starrii]|uniref:Uncharacterized protein n=1 Tax=Pleodorina starrii TaxID=330485 RepID=A0A9W6BLW9_9CHLO|nr:hypothetical protein PLESTB_000807300 [Pleodorina starrii]GLC70027.1 hypothetical protein PLESTF_000914800 [Pleodorina starrii]
MIQSAFAPGYGYALAPVDEPTPQRTQQRPQQQQQQQHQQQQQQHARRPAADFTEPTVTGAAPGSSPFPRLPEVASPEVRSKATDYGKLLSINEACNMIL